MCLKVAGKLLGPRPGLAIVSFWGGRIEIVLRILAILVTADVFNTAHLHLFQMCFVLLAWVQTSIGFCCDCPENLEERRRD